MGDEESNSFWKIKQEILEDLREKLVKDLQPERLFTFLRTKRVLDEDDCEEINGERTRRKRAEAFLDTIARKGEDGFDYFCEAFVVAGKTQLHLLNQILDAFESKIYDDEVKPVCVLHHEVIDVELLNHNLPRPGEPGAPCLPSFPNTLIQIPGGFQGQSQMIDSFATNLGIHSPPPPYSEY